jgi:hypothetical protein
MAQRRADDAAKPKASTLLGTVDLSRRIPNKQQEVKSAPAPKPLTKSFATATTAPSGSDMATSAAPTRSPSASQRIVSDSSARSRQP